MSKQIGLFGYGVVAQGFVKALEQNPQLDARIKTIVIKNPLKPRDLPGDLFTTDPQSILTDPDIDIVVELIDDAQAAFYFVQQALVQGKSVISANKKMIAENIRTIAEWHRSVRAPFLYEAAVAGSIPIIQTIEQFFGQQKITMLRGILNGSTNYILTQMREQSLSFDQALQLAQAKGFAESDPTLDISGQDAMNKLIILAYHAFGWFPAKEEIRVESITNMEDHFYDLAHANGHKIKSIATIYERNGSYRFKVQPEVVASDDELFGIENENNAIMLEGTLSGRQVYTGKGAGSLPTGAAVIHDLALLLKGFRYGKRPTREEKEESLVA